MNDKIKQILFSKQLSPSQFADEIGVQRSSISHILSGRNRPSLDIVQKIVRTYPDISYEWFLDDKSPEAARVLPAPHSSIPPLSSYTLPDDKPTTKRTSITVQPNVQENQNRTIVPETKVPIPSVAREIDRILIFYSDGTFLEYKPA